MADDFAPTKEMKIAAHSSHLLFKLKRSKLSASAQAKLAEPPTEDDVKHLNQCFQEADANGDGLLDLKEWFEFRKKFVAWQMKKAGGAVLLTEQEDTLSWRSENTFGPDPTGVAWMDLMHAGQVFAAVNEEHKYDSEWRVWYFAGYGRPEPLRQLLSHSGATWEDYVVNDWGLYKPTLQGGSLPQLEHKSGALKGGATRALVRYAALKYGYYPDDPFVAQQADMIVDAFNDLFGPGYQAIAGAPDKKPEARQKYFGELLPKFLTFLEPYCAKGQFLCGPKICIADFFVGSMVFIQLKNPHPESLGSECAAEWMDICTKFPAFKAWAQRYENANKKRFAQNGKTKF